MRVYLSDQAMHETVNAAGTLKTGCVTETKDYRSPTCNYDLLCIVLNILPPEVMLDLTCQLLPNGVLIHILCDTVQKHMIKMLSGVVPMMRACAADLPVESSWQRS